MECEHCGKGFSSEREMLEHTLEEHSGELTSHARDELKRRLNRARKEQASSGVDIPTNVVYALLGIAVLVGGGYGLYATGFVTLDTSPSTTGGQVTAVGAAGSTHEHAPLSLYINDRRVDFSQGRYQLQASRVHFEGGDGTTVHKHATGVSIKYTLDTLGIGINSTCIEMDDGQTYCEDDGSELSIRAGGSEVSPDYVIRDGVPVEIRYSGSN